MADRQTIWFDHSAIDAAFDYLWNRSDAAFKRLISMPGCGLAYRHHLWSWPGSKATIEEFWKKSLEHVEWDERHATTVRGLVEHLESGRQSRWLNKVLRYLPDGHAFDMTVYLVFGYDNIVFGEDVALNRNHASFHADSREAVYYLIHELAHAGYFRYHKMPDLSEIRTLGDLSDAVKLLTYLEGMGVISPLRLRTKEGGLGDDDYKVLLDEAERARRVRDYFKELERLETDPCRETREEARAHLLTNSSPL